jgi:hypothetical protein
LNYHTYLQDTRGIAFDRDTGILLVEAPSRLVASQLENHFSMTVRRVIASTSPSIHGLPITAVDFVPRRQTINENPKEYHAPD